MLIDKAITQRARLSRGKHYSAWYDFKKAYDSVSHQQLRRIIGVLPLHRAIKNLLRRALDMWSLRVRVGRAKTAPIYVKQACSRGTR